MLENRRTWLMTCRPDGRLFWTSSLRQKLMFLTKKTWATGVAIDLKNKTHFCACTDNKTDAFLWSTFTNMRLNGADAQTFRINRLGWVPPTRLVDSVMCILQEGDTAINGTSAFSEGRRSVRFELPSKFDDMPIAEDSGFYGSPTFYFMNIEAQIDCHLWSCPRNLHYE